MTCLPTMAILWDDLFFVVSVLVWVMTACTDRAQPFLSFEWPWIKKILGKYWKKIKKIVGYGMHIEADLYIPTRYH